MGLDGPSREIIYEPEQEPAQPAKTEPSAPEQEPAKAPTPEREPEKVPA